MEIKRLIELIASAESQNNMFGQIARSTGTVLLKGIREYIEKNPNEPSNQVGSTDAYKCDCPAYISLKCRSYQNGNCLAKRR